MEMTFRIGRYYGRLGVAGMVGFSAWCGLALYVARMMPDVRSRPLAALLMAGIPATMGGLSAWCGLAYRRARFIIQGDRIIVQGVLQRREISLPAVDTVRWRIRPRGGSVVLQSDATKLAISFGNYEPDAAAQIIGHLRSRLRPEVQSDWNLFAYKLAPFAPEAERNKLGPYDVVLRRSRLDRYFLPAMVAACIASGITWWLAGPSRLLAAPVQLLALWAIVRLLWPADGVVDQKLSHPDSAGLYWFTAVWLGAGVALLLACRLILTRRDDADTLLILGAAVWLAIFLFQFARQDRRRARRERVAADLAAEALAERPADP